MSHEERAAAPVVAFGSFRLDAANAALTRDGQTAPLTPKAFSVLEYLMKHAGRLVTKEELLDAVWAGVFVGDAALKVCIREIRKALDDDPKAPQYIETLHRRGYRFVAQVVPVEPRVATPAIETAAHAAAGAASGTVRTSESALPFDPPEIRYARSGDVNIAYQVIGDAPLDLVFVMGWVSHLDYFWREPSFARFLLRLASFSRLILFDKRGTGLSDRVVALPTLEQRMEDVRAVLDAVGSTRAALVGVSEGGPMCSLFAATYPEKTAGLVMIGTYAKRLWEPEYPWAPTAAEREHFFEEISTGWGGPVGIEERAPSRAHDPEFRNWWATYLRMGASPGAALALTRMNAEIDVRSVLPTVRVPSLIIHRTADRCLKVEEGRYVASRIPGARFVELPGEDHLPFVGDQDAILDEIEEFLTGFRHSVEPNRVLATVLRADVAPATAAGRDTEAARQDRMDRYDAHVRKEVEWFRGGRLTHQPGAFLATFDGPARAVRCASAVAAAATRFGVQVRIGVHTGECDVIEEGIAGPAVDLAERAAHQAQWGEVLVSRTVKDLVAGSGLRFDNRGLHAPAGEDDERRLFSVERARSAIGAA